MSLPRIPEIQKIYPLSPLQSGILFHYLYNREADPYFQQVSFAMEKELDMELLEKSFNMIIERYDVLRTSFVHINVDRPVQVVFKTREMSLYYVDITHLDKKRQEAYIEDFKQRDREKGFDLMKDILMRASVFKTGKKSFYILWSFHHIILEGWSFGIVAKELFDTYDSLIHRRSLKLDAVIPYSRYIDWLEEQDQDAAECYWKKYLEGYSHSAFIPSCTVSRQACVGYERGELDTRIDEDLTNRLRDISRIYQVTLNTVVQSLWGVLLGKYNGLEDVVFASVVSGRPSEISGIEKMVGLFINTIPVRVKYSGDMTFAALIREVQDNSIVSEKYSFYPLSKIQSNTALGRGMLDHVIVFENYPLEKKSDGSSDSSSFEAALKSIEICEQTNYDFDITVIPGKELIIRFTYNALAFEKDFIESIGLHLKQLAREVAQKPEIRIDAMDILTQQERDRIIYGFNNTKSKNPVSLKAYQLIEQQAARVPGNTAVIYGNKRLSYGGLNSRANQIARFLLGKGTEKEELVAIMLDRSEKIVECILGIWKAGGAYIPIDPEYPVQRILTILKESGARFLLTETQYIRQGIEEYSGEIVRLDLCADVIEAEADENLNLDIRIDSLAYVIYTSGSTGKPKGAMIEHLGMTNHILAEIDELKITNESVIAQNASQCFDISVWQFFAALTVGGKTAIYSKEVVMNPAVFTEQIIEDQVTILEVVPSFLSLMLDCIEERRLTLASLKYVMITGEAVKPGIVKRWFDNFPDIQVVNAYGPAEASDDVTQHIMAELPDSDSIPVGTPIQNTKIYIVDKHMKLCPVGIIGEICVSGICVGRGYLNEPEMSREVFIEDPFSAERGVRLYKTGDLGRWLPDGTIEFSGRRDSQVKIRGFRIELGEIESRLSGYPGVRESSVVVKESQDGSRYLCAYLVSKDALDLMDIKDYLQKALPDYMVPSYMVQLDEMPLSRNGKIDRKKLSSLDDYKKTTEEYFGPENEIEEKLAAIWQEVLCIEKVGVHDSFLDLGGDSIKAIQILSRLYSRHSLKLEIKDLFKLRTIRKLGEAVKSVSEKSTGTVSLEKAAVTPEEMELIDEKFGKSNISKVYPLSPLQEGMLFHWLLDKDSSTYFGNVMMTVEEDLDTALLEKSFHRMVEKYDILRTVFAYEKLRKPVQVVLKKRNAKVFFEDISHMEERQRSNYIEEYKKKELAIGFELSRDELVRMSILKIAIDKFVISWSQHHILMDGWCIGILATDLFGTYSLLKQGRQPSLSQPYSYSNYLKWIEQQDREEAFAYWRDYLRAYRCIPLIPKHTGSEDETGYCLKKQDITINKTMTGKLKDVSRKYNVTLNTVFQTLWGIMLQRYNNTDDVVFGQVVSGRHVEIEGIESILGLFINTIPLRIKCPKARFSEVITEVQADILQSERYSFLSLAEIQANAWIKENLIEHVTTFQNYPLEREFRRMESVWGINLTAVDIFEQSNYDLNVVVAVDDELTISLSYNAFVIKEEFIKSLESFYNRLVEQVVENPERSVDSMEIFSEEERIAHFKSTEKSNSIVQLLKEAEFDF